MSLNDYRSPKTISRFSKAAPPLCPSGILVPQQAPSPHSPLSLYRHVWAAGPAAELYSPVGRRRAGSRELAEGNTADHISSARAKYYSDTAFQTDTNCSSNKHRRANPWTFIRVGKDERKRQSQGAFERWPGVAGRDLSALLGFSPERA